MILQKLFPKTLTKRNLLFADAKRIFFCQFFQARKICQINSPINGEITVVEQFGQRKIMVGGLTQSGPMAEKVWEEGIKHILSRRAEVGTKILCGTKNMPFRSWQNFVPPRASEILILGLGGGSLVKLLTNFFPNAKITGIEIDPLMVNLGKKFLNLSQNKNLIIKIIDANHYVENTKEKYDLIFVDSYIGEKVPETLQTETFLKNLKKILKINGMIIFNCLYYKNHIFEAKIFLDKLKKIFNDLDGKKIFTNLIIYVSRNGKA